MAYTGFVGSGTVGNFSSQAALEAKFPATLNAGRMATVEKGDGTVSQYFSNGNVWDSLSERVDAVRGYSQSARISRLLEEAEFDLSIIVIGDSTGNEPTEWVDLLCSQIASENPAYTVRSRLWDNTAKSYASPVPFGAGAKFLDVWNCSVPGSKLSENFGSPFSAAFQGKSADLLIVNHGFNYPAGVPYRSIIGAYSAGVESLLKENPSAGVVIVAQPPKQNDENQSINVKAAREYAALRGFDVADIYSVYEKASRPADWYLPDGIHPTPTGSAVWMSVIYALFCADAAPVQSQSLFDDIGGNLLVNGLFGAVTGALPDSWTLTNSISALETTIYESGARAIKVTANGATPRMQQDLLTTNPAGIRASAGGWVTLAVRVYIPAGVGTGNWGTVALRTDDGEFQSSQSGLNGVTGGFFWVVTSAYLRKSPTLMRVYLYADTATGTTANVIFDRAVLVRGVLPKDAVA